MRKTRILFASLLTTSLAPIFVSAACANTNQEEAEVTPESISLTYGDGLTEDVRINENETLEFKTQVFPEKASQDVEITSENQSVAIIEDNKLIPKGVGSTRILANPVGYPGLKAQVNVTILESEDLDKIDETNVVNDGRLIGGLSDTYGIVLRNFKADFAFGHEIGQGFPHTLTSKIFWISDEDMEDDAAGITDIKVDSFNNTTFSTVCSFKSKKTIQIGHVFKFKLRFFVDSGTTSIIEGTQEYSITYDGYNDYAIDDSDVEKNIDFKEDDNKFAIIRGYKAPFYFGEGRYFDLTVNLNFSDQLGVVYVESIEIMNKVEAGGYTTFDLGIHTAHPLSIFNNVSDNTISFALNGIDVLISTGYIVAKTDTITLVTHTLNMLKDEGKSKLLIEGFESNFDFTKNDLSIQLSIGAEYPSPKSYNITFVNNKMFNVEFYWGTLLPEFESRTAIISFFLHGKRLLNSERTFSVSNSDNLEYIRFDGDNTLKVDFDGETNKYFTRVSTFYCGPDIDLDTEGGQTPGEYRVTFALRKQDDTVIPTSFSIDGSEQDFQQTFTLLMYWDQKPELKSPVYLDTLYDGVEKITALQLSFVDPDPTDFYTVNVSSNVGSIVILKNTQNQTIDLGIKDVNLVENELIGLDFSAQGIGEQYFTCFYSYEYNTDTESQYKILVHIMVNISLLDGDQYTISACDVITLNAFFAPINSIINFSKESTSSLYGQELPSFQTENKVIINPNTTYYIKASMASWSALTPIKEQYGTLDAFMFICGENISSVDGFMAINGELLSFCNCYILDTQNGTSTGIPFAYVSFGHMEESTGIIFSSEITFVWTPEITSPVTIDLGMVTGAS